ncbi:hypothetical protein PAXINDRAFT_15928 [Paxillus involutus ATCC 200175]|uniref:WW domain-containing protein n=1 Tax=Paxillus involutus ATCC 200175 TaxID=664439 RepID=A0A0C9T683_PAXIN|nr:hypothetical protein PAXINDRAFT_15928 [Paxillus involutus ATCC 200175]
MTAPSHKSPEPQYGRPSPVDAPYEMSSSGHLIPCSPAPSRQYTREHIPWISGSQTSLHAEPNAIDPESPHPVIHTPDGGATCESPRSKTPLSIRSTSQKSTSHRSIRSHNSAVSIGRASYRQHHGPPPRGRTPTPSIGQGRPVLVTGSSVTLGRAAPDSSSATPGRLVAPPNADDPNRPGEPTVNYNKPRFAPMSTRGVLRYQRHKQPNAIKRPKEPDHTISGMQYESPETQGFIPPGWTAHRHPEGALYFMHVESKTFTEVNVCNEDICEDIEYFKGFLFSELQDEIEKGDLSGSLKHDEVQLVLEPRVDEKHWDLFPNLCNITQELKDEVVDMILHATNDRLTSNRSLCPLNVEELKHHLSLVEKIHRKYHTRLFLVLTQFSSFSQLD